MCMNESAERSVRHPVPGRRFVRLTGRMISVGLFALLIYYVLFRLPLWWPPKIRLWSASYAFGFNNAIAVLALAALLGIAALLCGVSIEGEMRH